MKKKMKHIPAFCHGPDSQFDWLPGGTPDTAEEEEAIRNREPIDPVIKKALVEEGIVDKDYPVIKFSRKRKAKRKSK